MTISAATVKELRVKTNIGFMDCKEALLQTEGDVQEAILYLRKKGLMKADARAGRATKEGRIEIGIAQDQSCAYMIEVNCETDFVSKNDKFAAFTNALIRDALEQAPDTLDTFLAQKSSTDTEHTIEDFIKTQIATIGENIKMRRLEKITQKSPNGRFCTYIHTGAKIGVLLEVAPKNSGSINWELGASVLRDVAMHIAASQPQYIQADDIPADIIDKEKEIFSSQIDSKKPENIREKILLGKINKFSGEICLLTQSFIKNPEQTVAQYLEAQQKALGSPAVITQFYRYQLGD